ncbi:Membrane protein involved in the export of O-antigen and teichoic acid [Lachnospiraceae bacterium NE2001]|nr:Membrane protein involved in the export of O-antigen and teichoic acid [Lachnospiraceae bacterium NE2001]
MLRKLLFEGNINISRRTYIWNLASSLTFSLQSAIFLLVANRIGGKSEAGVFIILYVLAQTINSIGNYNLRDFQVSDIKEEYSFATFYTTRLLTCILMALVGVGYAIVQGGGASDWIVLASLVGYRFVECIEDVYHGLIQRRGRFDVTSICMTIRIVLSSVVFCVVYIITASPVVASLSLFISSLIIYFFTITVLKKEFALAPSFSTKNIGRLLVAGFPIFLGAFLYSYLINAPKYAINDLMDSDTQTIYNILFMPIFVVNILSTFIYKPLIVRLSEMWKDGKVREFAKSMIKMVAMILGMTVVVIIGGYVIGLYLLGVIYGENLAEYKIIFSLMLLFGGLAAIAFYFNTLITIIRKQYYIVLGYGGSFVINLFVTRRLVRNYGIDGAGYSYGVIVGSLALFYMIALIFEMIKKKKTTGKKWAE